MKEFCPSYCRNIDKPIERCSAPTYLTSSRDPKELDRCWHLDDVVYDKPYKIRLKWTRDQDREVMVVGENGNQYILEDGTYVSKNSPLIKEWL